MPLAGEMSSIDRSKPHDIMTKRHIKRATDNAKFDHTKSCGTLTNGKRIEKRLAIEMQGVENAVNFQSRCQRQYGAWCNEQIYNQLQARVNRFVDYPVRSLFPVSNGIAAETIGVDSRRMQWFSTSPRRRRRILYRFGRRQM